MSLQDLPRTIELLVEENRAVIKIIDQRALPQSLNFIEIDRVDELIDAIKTLAVRGAPALGVAGAMGVALFACNEAPHDDRDRFLEALDAAAGKLAAARPTAVNLSWGVARALESAHSSDSITSITDCCDRIVDRARQLSIDDVNCNRIMARYGADLLAPDSTVMTHCNAGSLATVFLGTALGVIYEAFDQGKIKRVIAHETRPLGQGARLTAWELGMVGVPCTLECDDMSAMQMATGNVDAVIVGADRICANGDTANKIGTYALAIVAAYHGVPFYVVAPTSTIDMTLEQGSYIPIEFRDASEVIA